LIRDARELEQLLLAPNRGRTAWVLLEGEPAAEPSRAGRELGLSLMTLAVETRRPPGGRIVLKLQL
jgi:hypothetical protein